MDDTWIKQVQEVNESMKLVFDLTSRIDERMKILIENNNESKERIEKLFDNQTLMLNRVSAVENKVGILDSKNTNAVWIELKKDLKNIESKVEGFNNRLLIVEKDMGTQSNKWANLIDFVFKIAQIVIGAIILWKIGIKP